MDPLRFLLFLSNFEDMDIIKLLEGLLFQADKQKKGSVK
jgi:hypothetical protein